jgi:hypothetical protein
MRFAFHLVTVGTLTLAIGCGSGAAWAQSTNAFSDAPGSPASPLPPVLERVIGSGGHATYLGAIDGLQGYLLTTQRTDGSYLAIPAYVTPSGQSVILGRAHAVDGTDDTSKQEDRLALRLQEAENDVTPTDPLNLDVPTENDSTSGPNNQQIADAAEQDIEQGKAADFADAVHKQTANFQVGNPNAPSAFLIGDSNCAQCAAENIMLRSMINGGKLNLIVVPASSNPVTSEETLELLSQSHPAEAWFTNDLDPSQHAHDENDVQTWLASNNEFAETIGATVTPVLAYLNSAGRWTLSTDISGTPPNLATTTISQASTP